MSLFLRASAFAALAVLSVGCQQEMARQPSFRKYQPTAFFADGKSERPPPEGAVSRQALATNGALASGLKPDAKSAGPAPAVSPEPAPTAAPSDPGKFADGFPFRLTDADLQRGQERYTIYCAVCHGPLGDGNGKIPERGYLRPPNYHADDSRGFSRYRKSIPLREVPVGYLFEVVTRGYGAMPQYAHQIPADDRWRIVAYVRALQLSQHAEVKGLPEEQRRAVEAALGGTP